MTRPSPTQKIVPKTIHRRLLRKLSSMMGLVNAKAKFWRKTKRVLVSSKKDSQRVRRVGRTRNQNSRTSAGPAKTSGMRMPRARRGRRSAPMFRTKYSRATEPMPQTSAKSVASIFELPSSFSSANPPYSTKAVTRRSARNASDLRSRFGFATDCLPSRLMFSLKRAAVTESAVYRDAPQPSPSISAPVSYFGQEASIAFTAWSSVCVPET